MPFTRAATEDREGFQAASSPQNPADLTCHHATSAAARCWGAAFSDRHGGHVPLALPTRHFICQWPWLASAAFISPRLTKPRRLPLAFASVSSATNAVQTTLLATDLQPTLGSFNRTAQPSSGYSHRTINRTLSCSIPECPNTQS